MLKLRMFKLALTSGACTIALATAAHANSFNIPNGDLKHALDAYMKQADVTLMYPEDEMHGVVTRGAHGELSTAEALARILRGTGFSATQDTSGIIGIVRDAPARQRSEVAPVTAVHLASADRAASSVETVVVTSSKIKGDIQTVPIAITALSQEQLTSRQIAGGPDLVKEVPNLTFSKTNFSGYTIQIRGIGTQAISVTTDPAVAVALNDIPFIRNHFFEQEFFDVNQVEVLRGPQGTLYGRNATAGVVNVITAKPTDQFEAMLSADWGNYTNRRYEGMVNIPIVDDRFDLRVAGEWTKRNGYSTNEFDGQPIDGRDLWSGRVTLGFKPSQNFQAYLIWEHFAEDDDRLRSGKQLCTTALEPGSVGGQSVPNSGLILGGIGSYLSQGCQMGSLYAPSAYGVPDGYSLPYYTAAAFGGIVTDTNPYLSDKQNPDLRVINTQIKPTYKAKSDLFEFNADYEVTPSLTFSSATGFNHDFLWSTEDYNRFASSPGVFVNQSGDGLINNGIFCDPQVGCSNKIVAEDLSEEHSWQLSQEFRLASHFEGPFNFSVGGNYLHYETDENYYVFINTLTAFTFSEGGGDGAGGVLRPPYTQGVSDNSTCLSLYGGYRYHPPALGGGEPEVNSCVYVDPNPIGHLNNNGHNYFLSRNPYTLNSYAAFGEAYYDISSELKLTTGARWTVDKKHVVNIPSELLNDGWGYPADGVVDQQWGALTGRAALNWTPKLDFTEQTLVYGSYAHGYKAGGANPPGPVLPQFATGDANPVHPLTFKPEYVDAFELGSKNTLLDGALTLNGDVFFYNYKAYQISEIVDRTAINQNFDAKVKGAEIEAVWEPIPGLRFNASGGYEDARVAKGQQAVDLIDRTDRANHPDWMVVRPFPTQASNCILPTYVVAAMVYQTNEIGPGPLSSNESGTNPVFMCNHAYVLDFDPVTQLSYVANPTTVDPNAVGPNTLLQPGYTGFNPEGAPNGGQGFAKDLSNHQLPNAPHFTTSLSAEYTLPVSEDWAATLHSDFYWQSQSWARVFNDNPYDKIRGYSNVNLALIVTSANGWQVMGYLKNVFDTTAITGDFLNSDDSDLTTNVFLTDPRLFGVRVTKNW